MALRYADRLALINDIVSDLIPLTHCEYDSKTGYAAAFVFNNLFEECWKLIREILVGYYGYEDSLLAAGGRTVIGNAINEGFINKRWMKMLVDRNESTHDYRNKNLQSYWEKISDEYLNLVIDFVDFASMKIKEPDIMHSEF